MSEDVDTTMDGTATGRVAGVLAKVQIQVPEASDAYVYSGAVRVGLNRLASPRRTYTNGQYVPQSGTGVVDVTVSVEDDDIERADAIAAARSTTRDVVVGAALCTGLAMLSGLDVNIVGPFKV